MNEMRERIERLEQVSEAAELARHVAERRARCWQSVAGLLVGLGLVLLPLQSGTAQGQGVGNLAARVATLEAQNTAQANQISALQEKLVHVTRDGNDLYITGANLHVRNALGSTETADGLGNVVIGYNEGSFGFERTGSHNLVVGSEHGWTSFGGLVAGQANQIMAPYSSVTGGSENTANGPYASVSGGRNNVSVGDYASVSGGGGNVAFGTYASVSGGKLNRAFGELASISGGARIESTASDGWAAGSLGPTTFVGDFRSP